MPEPEPTRTGAADQAGKPPERPINAGPGRVLIGVYALFALSAGARAGHQIATRLGEAPLAYLLSALAAAIYLVATVGLALGGRTGRRIALVCCTVELVGVLVVGTISLLFPATFPDATVWSGYGRGYGFVPLVLPILGLYWLWRTSPRRAARDPETHQGKSAL